MKYFYFSQFLKVQLISTCLRWFTYFSHDNRWDLEKKLYGVVTIVASSSVSFGKLALLLQVFNINIKLFCCLWKLFCIVHVIAIWAIETQQFFKALHQSSSSWFSTCLLELLRGLELCYRHPPTEKTLFAALLLKWLYYQKNVNQITWNCKCL